MAVGSCEVERGRRVVFAPHRRQQKGSPHVPILPHEASRDAVHDVNVLPRTADGKFAHIVRSEGFEGSSRHLCHQKDAKERKERLNIRVVLKG